jgi:hypothetical protein
MIYELRQYTIERGRMNDNHDRMANFNIELFRKHGVNAVARWAAVAGPRMPLFCYLMQWKSFEEREAAWGSFYADPEWAKVRTATNAGSEMVENYDLLFLRPHVAFRQVDADLGRKIGGVHQIIVQKIMPGQNPAVAKFLSAIFLPRLRAAGAHVIGVCDVVSGQHLPSIVMIIAWKDEQSWWEGWRAFQNDPELLAAYRKQRADLQTTLFGTSETIVLEPAPYALPTASLQTLEG